MLDVPRQIHQWRGVIWDVIRDSTVQRVQSFAELATALSARAAMGPPGGKSASGKGLTKLPPALADFFRSASPDDEMRGFLSSAVEYLSSVHDGSVEVPVSIIHAMNDAERIAQIEEMVLPPEKLNLFRHCILQIARLAGDNG